MWKKLLDPVFTTLMTLELFLQPFSFELMEARDISFLVKSSQNDSAGVSKPSVGATSRR